MKKYQLNELIEKMKPQHEKDKALMQKCVKGIALYAGQLAQADPASPEISEMRSLVMYIACYWGLDDGDGEKLQNNYIQPFDDTIASARAGENLTAAIMRQRAPTIHGLYRFGIEMVHTQGIDCKDDILAMSCLMRKLSTAWGFESDLLDNLASSLDNRVFAMESTQKAEQEGQMMDHSL